MLTPWGTKLALVEDRPEHLLSAYTVTEDAVPVGRVFVDHCGDVYRVTAVSFHPEKKLARPESRVFLFEYDEEPFEAALSWITCLGPERVRELIKEERAV